MPRQLALLLCLGFVLYLLRYDRKQSYESSWVLWMPTLWFLFNASRSIDAWVQVTGGSRVTGGVLDPFFNAWLLIGGTAILVKRKFNWSRFIRQNGWLFWLIVLMLVSTVWSDMPARSLRSGIREVIAVLMAFVLASEPDPKQAMQSILRRTTYILVPISMLLVKYYRDKGVTYASHSGEVQWIGATLQKNSLGQLCLIAGFFLLWTFYRRWQGRERPVAKHQTACEIVVLLITAWLFKGPSMWAASASGLLAFGFGLATFVALLWMKRVGIPPDRIMWSGLTGAIVIFGFLAPLAQGSFITAFSSALGRDATLTGRTEIWAGLIPEFWRQPILGYGFSGFWTDLRTAVHQIGQAHNGYLDVALQLGLVGLLFTGGFLVSCAGKAQRLVRQDFDWGSLCLCFVLMTVTQTIAESSIDSFNRQLMGLVLLVSVASHGVGKGRVKPGSGSVAAGRPRRPTPRHATVEVQ